MGKVLIAGGSLYYTDKNPESRLCSGYEGPQEVTWQTSCSKLGHYYILSCLGLFSLGHWGGLAWPRDKLPPRHFFTTPPQGDRGRK